MSAAIHEPKLETATPVELRALAETSSEPCVSILMRTHRAGRDTQQGRIRLKNMLGDARQKLRGDGKSDSLLDPIETLLNDSTFWQHQGDGLAIYATSERWQAFRLDRPVDERVHVDDSFFILPLIENSNSQTRFLALALTWHNAVLYDVDGDTVRPIETELLPAAFDDLITPRDAEVSLQNTSHRSVGNSGGSETAMFHGHGEGEDKIEADRRHYLSIVGEEVSGVAYDLGLPVIVAATGEVVGKLGAFSKLSIAAVAEGSPDGFSEAELHRRVRTAHQPNLAESKREMKERFGLAVAKSQGSTDHAEILAAAKSWRIDAVALNTEASDLQQINAIAVEALRCGGDVITESADEMPIEGASASAIYRY
tara:strand:- start:200826 stop:201932 length:1107 start_codon:yes stop_codon:yes gene_type:complete